ncbi:MAG: hypothetical protein ABSB55_08345 [Acidimicrobiales bacterium]|jgi:hypothetical protein
MAASFNGPYRWQLFCPRRPRRGLDNIELVTLGYVDSFNHRRLHDEITNDAICTTPTS